MKRVSQKILHQGKWLTFQEEVFETSQGERVLWETLRRNHPGQIGVVIARLMPSRRFVFIKQFRPAINGYILGLPTGMIGKNPKDALRELKEETGYIGKIVDQSPALSANAGMINDDCTVVCVEINENDPRNKNPQQELEPTEVIEVILVKESQARKFLLAQGRKKIRISSGLWYIFGLQLFVGPQSI